MEPATDWRRFEKPETVFLLERLLQVDMELAQEALRVLEKRWVRDPQDGSVYRMPNVDERRRIA